MKYLSVADLNIITSILTVEITLTFLQCIHCKNVRVISTLPGFAQLRLF